MRRSGPDTTSTSQLAIALVVSVFLAALGLRPRAVVFDRLLARASAAAAAGQPAAAQASMEKALAFDPALASLRLTAANLALQAGDLDAARRNIEAAPAEVRQTPLYACLSARVGAGAPTGAVPGCASQSPSPEPPVATIPPLDSLASVAASLAAELDLNPNDLPTWEKLAALEQLSHPEAVESVLLRAYRTFPEGSQVLDGLWQISHARAPGLTRAVAAARTGQLMAVRGEWGLAGAAWARAVELEPDFPEATAFLGLATSKTGGDGLPYLLQAVGEAPEDPIVRSLLG